MASPAVRSFLPAADSNVGGCFTSGSTAGTNHNAVLPTPIEAGDVLIIAGRVAGAGAVGFPAGWTVVQDSSDGSDDVSFWAYRNAVADGTEDGTNVNVTHGTFKITGHSLAISGAEAPGTQAPQTGTVAVGTSTTPDPTTTTPTGGSKDYLWLWYGSWDGEQTLSKTAPTNYTDLNDVSTGTASTVNHQQKMAWRQTTAASEDAGSITISAAPLGWTAWLIAVHPGAAGTTNNETGVNTSAAVLAGADVHEAVEAGAPTADTLLAGADVHEAARLGAATTTTVLAGADVHEAVETGATTSAAVLAGVAEVAAGGITYEKAGAVVTTTVAAGADVFEAVEAGSGLVTALMAGVSQYVPPGPVTYEKAGSVAGGTRAAAADAYEAVEAGAIVAGTLYVGADVFEAVEAGAVLVTTRLAGLSGAPEIYVPVAFGRPSPAGGMIVGTPGALRYGRPSPERGDV